MAGFASTHADGLLAVASFVGNGLDDDDDEDLTSSSLLATVVGFQPFCQSLPGVTGFAVWEKRMPFVSTSSDLNNSLYGLLCCGEMIGDSFSTTDDVDAVATAVESSGGFGVLGNNVDDLSAEFWRLFAVVPAAGIGAFQRQFGGLTLELLLLVALLAYILVFGSSEDSCADLTRFFSLRRSLDSGRHSNCPHCPLYRPDGKVNVHDKIKSKQYTFACCCCCQSASMTICDGVLVTHTDLEDP